MSYNEILHCKGNKNDDPAYVLHRSIYPDDPRLTEIDARRFSINQFNEAKSMDWCLSYNEILHRKGNKNDDPAYTDEKFNNIFNYIVQSEILSDIEHQENLAARLGERLKMRMVSYCKRRPNSY